MGKAPIEVEKYFVVIEMEDGKEVEFIYDPPLLAECGNIRVELRKEKNHARPHVHVLKKGKTSNYELSLALDNLDVLAGNENMKHFRPKELEAVLDFIEENLAKLEQLYRRLRGEL